MATIFPASSGLFSVVNSTPAAMPKKIMLPTQVPNVKTFKKRQTVVIAFSAKMEFRSRAR
jgi:hypothetical protein